MEYITEQLVERVFIEITTQKIDLFESRALIKATAKDYIRNTQIRFVLQPVINKLSTIFLNKNAIEIRPNQILSTLQKQFPLKTGYARTYLDGYDFSNLNIRQAYLQGQTLRHVNFANSDLDKSVFTKI